MQVSDEALMALNIAQKKEFVINEDFAELLREVDERDSVAEFTTEKEFEAKKREFYTLFFIVLN